MDQEPACIICGNPVTGTGMEIGWPTGVDFLDRMMEPGDFEKVCPSCLNGPGGPFHLPVFGFHADELQVLYARYDPGCRSGSPWLN